MHTNKKTNLKNVLEFSLIILLTACSMCGCGSGKAESVNNSPAQSANHSEDTEQGISYAENKQKSDIDNEAGVEIDLNSDCAAMTRDETEDLVYAVYDAYCEEACNDPDRIEETTYDIYTTQYEDPGDQFAYGTIRYNGYEMKYGIQVIGEPDNNGTYPLYIALHGGGEADQEENDQQWEDMFYYYGDSVADGIYVNVRGIADTWNLHFLDESYYMYDRLIEDMILFENADANRIYLLGFSAGGDGVYQVAVRMADRFAAADMSSGHPNDISLINLMNLPILLQAGIRDNAFDRNTVTAEAGLTLDELSGQYGYGYLHDVFIHVPEGHNYDDNDPDDSSLQEVIEDPYAFLDEMEENAALREVVNDPDYAYAFDDEIDESVDQAVGDAGLNTVSVDTNAVRWVSQYNRDPYPEQLVWDLDTRALGRSVESFYYLKAPAETKGLLSASYDRSRNSISVDTSKTDGDFSILFNPFMLDLSQPVILNVDDVTFKINAAPSEGCIRTSIEETSDLSRVYAAEISYSELLSYTDIK